MATAAISVNTNILVCEARTLGFDDVLLDPTDNEIVHAVAEMVGVDFDHITNPQRERIVRAYDYAQAQLDPIKRQVWA